MRRNRKGDKDKQTYITQRDVIVVLSFLIGVLLLAIAMVDYDLGSMK